ncbi:MAG: MerR family transcriptional regulator [Ktedonobacteraceae bacterium]|nr:MerR family transcriptional regulator [Chloroflexota bacterium]
MRERPLFRIGEFARVGQVSVATLRHYEKFGLLTPHTLDPDSGYRYYTLDQLARLHRILALKELGFPWNRLFACSQKTSPWTSYVGCSHSNRHKFSI